MTQRRPFITHDIIAKLVQNAHHHGAKNCRGSCERYDEKVSMNGIIEETVDRESLLMVQTPQAFRFELIMEAEDVAEKVGFLGTDEAMLMERLGHQVHIVESSYENVKMTTQEDLVFGEAILRKRGSFNH